MSRTGRFPRTRRPRTPGPICLVGALVVTACGPQVPPELQPDEVLRAELGLTDDDEVHRVRLIGADVERAEPAETVVPPGAWVEFVTTDWRVHEVRFDLDSLGPAARAFLEGSDQVASPPMVDLGARFVVSFHEAPAGRYPFLAEGNGATGRGVVVVRPNP